MKEYKGKIDEIKLKKIKSDFVKVKITDSKSSYECIKNFYYDDIDIFESFFILLLNRNNNTIGFAKISQGGVSGTVCDIKIILKYAIDTLCSSIIISHNHPSGNTQPSSQDDLITKKVKEALSIFDISLLDHIIITSESYFSYADEGKI